MKKMMVCLVLLLAAFAGSMHAQDISGNWQGTLKAGIDLRIIREVSKGPNGALSARLYKHRPGAGRGYSRKAQSHCRVLRSQIHR